MDSERYDAVIAGGGLAGLSLAARLATGGWHDRSVLIVDDALGGPAAVAGPANGRGARAAAAWGFWSDRPGLLDAAVSRTYHAVRVHAGGRERVLPLGRYAYHIVRRDDLRRVACGLIDGCPGFALRPGRVGSVRERGDAAEVVVDGTTILADWVFDSVSPPPPAPVIARLAFTGWEVSAERPVFDPDVPVLFDFRTPQSGGGRFVYVLPTDARRALVELTEFVPRRAALPGAGTREAALRGYLAGVLGAPEYRVLRTESAVLPLRVRAPARSHGRVVRIGARAGLIKASTGYAYQRIQRDSAAIAGSLARSGRPRVPGPGRWYRLLDGVLLDVFDRDPAQLEHAFARLFAANPAPRVLRFLDEQSGAWDQVRLCASLPPGPYLRALAARLLRRGRD